MDLKPLPPEDVEPVLTQFVTGTLAQLPVLASAYQMAGLTPFAMLPTETPGVYVIALADNRWAFPPAGVP